MRTILYAHNHTFLGAFVYTYDMNHNTMKKTSFRQGQYRNLFHLTIYICYKDFVFVFFFRGEEVREKTNACKLK